MHHRGTSASGACIVEWRPSRCVVFSQIALGLLGAAGLLLCDLPTRYAVPSAAAALLLGIAGAVRERRRPPMRIDATELDLHWRGPLAFDRRTGLSWWPDTLDAAGRRTLRLAVHARE
jgi:toxin CptA